MFFVISWLVTIVTGHAADLACKQPTLVGASTWYPNSYQEQGQLKGIGPEVVKLVMSELNIPYKTRTGLPWPRVVAELTSGKVDILASSYWTQTRAQQWQMSHQVFEETLNVFTLKSQRFSFDSWRDLIGKRGVITRGVALGNKLQANAASLNLLTVNSHQQGFTMLTKGRADYLILGRYSAIPYLQQPSNRQVIMLAKALNRYSVRVAFSKNSQCQHLFTHFNQVLADKIADGAVAKIIARYLPTPADE